MVHDIPSAPVVDPEACKLMRSQNNCFKVNMFLKQIKHSQVEHRIEHVAVRKMEALEEVGPLGQKKQNKRRVLKLNKKAS